MKIMVDAYLDNNLGDDLMIMLLAENFKEHQFYLYSDASIIKNTYKGTANIEVRASHLQKKDLDEIDVYLSLGGSIFQLANWKYYLCRMRKVFLLKKLKMKSKKIATLGSNLGPFGSNIGIKITALELRQNDLVTVRDQASLDLIQTFKGMSNYHFAEDLVYNLQDERAKKKSGLGISAYRSIKTGETNYPNYKALAKIADTYIAKTGKNVYLFAFDTESENDLAAANYIYELARQKEKVFIVPYLGNPEFFLETYKKCERMIAIRFHSAVLSDYYQIPFLPVAYSNKMENLMADRQYAGNVLKLKTLHTDMDLDSLVDKIISMDGLYHNFSTDFESARKHLVEFDKLLNA